MENSFFYNLPNNRQVVLSIFGSHLYQLATPASDKDYKGIYIPSLKDLLLNQTEKAIKYSSSDDLVKNQADDIDIEIYSLAYFIDLACKGETMTIDMLHSDAPLISSDIWQYLVKQRQRFYTKNMKSFIGYVKEQAHKYGVKGSRLTEIQQVIQLLSQFPKNAHLRDIWAELQEYEYVKKITLPLKLQPDKLNYYYEVAGRKYQDTLTIHQVLSKCQALYDSYGKRAKLAESNAGVDWKAVSHAFRAAFQLRAIYKYGDYSYPLAETNFLMQLKLGQLDYQTEVGAELDQLVEEVMQLAEKSNFPEKVDSSFWENFLLDVYYELFKIPKEV